MVKFRNYKLREIFNWQPQKEIDPLKIHELTIHGDIRYPFYGQATHKNGIISYLSLKEDVLNNIEGKPTILIHSNNQNVVYLETPFYLKNGHGATSVLQADFLNEKIALYLIACIKKVITKRFSYNEKATKIALKNTDIQLPITESGQIDYSYMQHYIDKLEKESMFKLDTYLKANGFTTYQLTEAEERVIKLYNNKEVICSNFKVGELFDIHPTKSYGYTNRILFKTKGKTPVIVNSSIGNGIGGYVGLEPTEKGNIITFTDTTTSEGIFYQPNDFIGYSHIQGLYPLHNIKWSENALLYFLAVFKKQVTGRFDYATKFNRKIAAEITIQLPINLCGEIDFEFMENFIQAQKKLSIKSIIDWKDNIAFNNAT